MLYVFGKNRVNLKYCKIMQKHTKGILTLTFTVQLKDCLSIAYGTGAAFIDWVLHLLRESMVNKKLRRTLAGNIEIVCFWQIKLNYNL